MAGFTSQRQNMLGARLMSPIDLSRPNRNALSGQQAQQMQHGSIYGQTTPQGNQTIAENAENKRKIAIQEEYYRLQTEDPERFARLPPLPDLMREPSAWQGAMAPFTGPDTNQNASNAMTATLGSQFAGGLIPAAKQIQTKGIMSLLDPRMSPGQVNMMTYHGSPHRINNVDDANPMGKFDLGKIGTGEGAQAYGHGIYLAENPDVARIYAEGLSRYNVPDTGPVQAAHNFLRFPQHADKARGHLVKAYPELSAGEVDDVLGQAQKAVDEGKQSSFYEVDLPDEHIAKMLDWDAPLSEQPQAVRDALQKHMPEIQPVKLGSGNYGLTRIGPDGSGRTIVGIEESSPQAAMAQLTGERAYHLVAKSINDGNLGGEAAASAKLNELGIPGIKYLDGNSRTEGEGTRNFVAFDPEIAKILSRNGERAALPTNEASRMAFPDEVKSIKGEPVRALNEARAATKANPVEVYHSTGADFTEFDSEKGIGGQLWFTSSADKAKAGYDGAAGSGRTITASVDIRNPAGWDEYDKFGTDELMGRGYDGLKLEGSDGEVTYVAFFPEQVRVKSNAANKAVSGIGGLGAGGLMTPEGRQYVANDDGSYSTEVTVTVIDPRINGGKPTNIPSMYNGKIVSEDEAADIIAKNEGRDPETGREMQGYASIAEAVKAAKARSKSIPPPNGLMSQDEQKPKRTNALRAN
jgi:hypothetical protein